MGAGMCLSFIVVSIAVDQALWRPRVDVAHWQAFKQAAMYSFCAEKS